MLWNAFVQRKSAGVGVGQTLTQHYTKYSSNNTPTEGQAALRGNISPSLISPIPRRGNAGGVLGGVFGKHPPRWNPFVQRCFRRLGGVLGCFWREYSSGESGIRLDADDITFLFCIVVLSREEVFRPRENGRPTMSRNTAHHKSACHFLRVVNSRNAHKVSDTLWASALQCFYLVSS